MEAAIGKERLGSIGLDSTQPGPLLSSPFLHIRTLSHSLFPPPLSAGWIRSRRFLSVSLHVAVDRDAAYALYKSIEFRSSVAGLASPCLALPYFRFASCFSLSLSLFSLRWQCDGLLRVPSSTAGKTS